jgi:hypothetical protein
MNERDEIVEVIIAALEDDDSEGLGTWEETCAWSIKDRIRALFAESPWFANNLLPNGWHVAKGESVNIDDFGAIAGENTPEAGEANRLALERAFEFMEERDPKAERLRMVQIGSQVHIKGGKWP